MNNSQIFNPYGIFSFEGNCYGAGYGCWSCIEVVNAYKKANWGLSFGAYLNGEYYNG
jgi:hypothetical protein